MQDIAVLKFGGSSVKSIGRLQHVAEIIRTFPARKKIVIVSAMGDTTDYLLKLAKQCSLIPDKRELDLLLSSGEQVSIALLALTLSSTGIKAKAYTGQQLGIITDDSHSKARILSIRDDLLNQAIEENEVTVVAGFQGCSQSGEITTLGRGGSDTSAVAVAVAAGADTCHIYTDVDGIYSADPSRVSNARFIEAITYEESLELARSGAQVIHPRAVELAQDHNLKLRIRNTFKPEHEGTLIGDSKVERKQNISGVAIDSHVALLKICGVVDSKEAFANLEGSSNIIIDALTSALTDECEAPSLLATVKYSDIDELQLWSNSVKKRFGNCEVVSKTEVAKVSLIGQGLAADRFAAARLISILANKQISIKQLSCSDIRISAIVPLDQAQLAAEAIHSEFSLETRLCTQDILSSVA